MMTKTKGFVSLVAVSLIATAAFGYRAMAQNAEEGGAQASQQDGMAMQCPMMNALKSVQLHADSPAVLLGQSESLELTAEQQEQLKEIAAAARERAQDVLSDTQRQQLAEAPEGPLSPMQLVKLQKQGEAGEDKGKMCPMCMKMMQRMKQQKHSEDDHTNGQR